MTPSARDATAVAWAGVDATVPLGSVIRLDGTESFDPENDPLTYDWRVVSVPPGSAATLDDPSSPTPSFTADAVGDFVFRLVVNDGTHGSAPDTVVVTAAPPPPNGAPTADAGPDTLAIFGSPFSLDGSRSADPDGDPLTYRWSVAGAPFGSTAVLGDPSSSHPVFTPDLLGFYEFTLVVNDGTSDSAPDSVFVSVVPSATVPACVGVSLSIARTRILGAGLGVGNITYASSSTVPAGRIISQDPPAGTIVPEGSPVDLVVSSGP